MKFENKMKTTLFLATFAATMSACGHAPIAKDFPDTASPNEEVAKFDTDINAALKNQVNVLAPNNFKEAQSSLKAAKKSLDKQKDAKDTLHLVAQGRAYFNRATEVAQLSHANIDDVITARQQAIVAGASNLLPKEFQNTDESLEEVTSDIEDNRLQNAIENRSSLQLKYLALELQSIKQTHLGLARDTIAQSEKEGAKNFAPRSLALAEKSVHDTDAFITANRHDATEIATRSGETLKSSEHLLKITRDSKSGKKTSSEELALQMENEQNKVADKQVQLNAKESQLESKQNQLAQGESAIQALSADKLTLEAQQAFQQRFEVARTQFTQSEAEVYKQGNTLMIRLRGLEFPVSQAVLKGSNFPLLAKVNQVIKDFGKSSVIVEGHTDSNGGAALNDRLSSDRAQAVREYLFSHAGDQPIQIRAVGYGYQKPLATNKTQSGRAQNRRVDILIQPETL